MNNEIRIPSFPSSLSPSVNSKLWLRLQSEVDQVKDIMVANIGISCSLLPAPCSLLRFQTWSSREVRSWTCLLTRLNTSPPTQSRLGTLAGTFRWEDRTRNSSFSCFSRTSYCHRLTSVLLLRDISIPLLLLLLSFQRAMWWKNMKLTIGVSLGIIVFLYILVCLSCGGLAWPKCVWKSHSEVQTLNSEHSDDEIVQPWSKRRS